MFVYRIDRVLFLSFVTCCVLLGSASVSFGQSDDRSPSASVADVDLEVELDILVASNAVDNTKLPVKLDGIAKRLRPTLPFTNYRLGATFLSRVKNGRPVSVKGVGRTLLTTPALESSVLPTFYEISAGAVTLKTDSTGRDVVQISPFRFGLRIPLQTGTTRGNGSSDSGVLYEPVGITTEVTIREGDAVVIGTLDAGRPNETLVLVLVVKRAS